MVRLRASDGEELEMEMEAAMLSPTIRRKMEELSDNCVLDLDIDSKTLAKVIHYCTVHACTSGTASRDLTEWDADFINIDDSFVSNLISASSFLDIRALKLLSIGKKILTIRSQDYHDFVVEGKVALRIKFISDILEAEPTAALRTILLPNVPTDALSCVIEYCRKHCMAEAEGLPKKAVQKIDKEFIVFNHGLIFEMIRAASFLQIKSLLKLAVETVKALNEFEHLSLEEITSRIAGRHYTRLEERDMVTALGLM